MFKNYLKIAPGNFLRHKIYSAVNLAGLALGVAICILFLLFVRTSGAMIGITVMLSGFTW
ncbi:MAG: hypothetical protein ONB44_22400 [candidate division KSB1 bacterium]|nr:hypothetical protein [candidate division KSB1 bacterium]MDZ7304889.1 hypothetical protein [candidate division KSB1 bacterium]